jgi:thiol-disulfide isomerase/thioredoxin
VTRLKSLLAGIAALSSALFVNPALGQDFSRLNGKAMPPFVLTTIGGKKITNRSLKGKVVLFDFWATWCGPCKMASPAMQKIYEAYSKKGVVVIGADTFERNPGPAGAKGYKAEHKYAYTFTYDNDGLARTLGIQAIPAFALVDQHGIIRGTLNGVPRTNVVGTMVSAFSKKINTLLKG